MSNSSRNEGNRCLDERNALALALERSGMSASSAGSSPRRINGKNLAKESSALPLASRPPCHSSALHSAWIQRIIPSHSLPEKNHLEVDKANELYKTRAAEMETDDDQGDADGYKFKKSDNPSRSWLAVQKSADELGRAAASEGRAEFPFLKSAKRSGSMEQKSASLDSKVVPVLGDVVIHQAAAEDERNRIPKLSSSAWFARFTDIPATVGANTSAASKSRVADAEDGSGCKAIRSFPPLKSGEQWPGTLKPSGLPPLRIPSSRSCAEDDQLRLQQLPLLTPVLKEEQISKPDVDGKKTPADLLEEEETSTTCSLPSNFIVELHGHNPNLEIQEISDTNSLPGRYLINASTYTTSRSLSDTKSLFQDRLEAKFQDEVDSASVNKTRQMEGFGFHCFVAAAADNSFASSSFSERSNQSTHGSCESTRQQQQPVIARQIPFPNEQEENDRTGIRMRPNASAVSAKAAASSNSSKLLIKVAPQQWLQRWCTTPPGSSTMRR